MATLILQFATSMFCLQQPGSQNDISPRRFHHVQVGGLRNLYVLCALIRRVEERRPQPTNLRTVNYQYVLYHVLNSYHTKVDPVRHLEQV